MTDSPRFDETRAFYDAVAADYAELLRDELDTKPVERALLALFAELVRGRGGGEVVDLGCGPGRVTAHLRSLGVNAFGIDLSPEMVAVARRSHPGLRFEEGSMTALDLADGSVAGAVLWYSTVHMTLGLLPAVFAEVHRVLAPGGRLLVGFKAGDARHRLNGAYGHDEVSLDVYWTPPEQMAELMSAAGLAVDTRTVREPDESERPRPGPQAFFLARRPETPGGT